jgi:2-phospho-L-lactate guanylyltransferase
MSSIAVLPGDLPFLSSGELDRALTCAREHPMACVADQHGTGTTFLTARRGESLIPSFGSDSFSRHRAIGAAPLRIDAKSGLR